MGWTKEEKDGYVLVKQENGAELGYSPQSGVRLIEQDGFLFKDLAGGGQLLPYLDWRLSYEERAADLASRLSIEQIAGLMLYSNHQAIPATSYDVSLYNGKPYSAGEANPWDITDNQRRFITEDNLRHILVTIVESPVVAAKWNNRVQALVEGIGFGIPANNSSDPRHSARADAEFNSGGGPCESGRDAHYGSGKYAVYPGNCFNLHKIPFTQGAFKLSSATNYPKRV